MKYDTSTVVLANLIIAGNMFAVSLELKWVDFLALRQQKKPALAGLFGQFILLPLITFLFTLIVPMRAELILALILVSVMPGGNLSNVFTYLAKGNVPLSMSMTALGFPMSVLMAPLNFSLYTSFQPALAGSSTLIHIDPIQMAAVILVTLLLPLVLGVWVGQKYSRFCASAKPYIPPFTLVTISMLVVVVVQSNWHLIRFSDWQTPSTVAIHHCLVLYVSLLWAKSLALSPANQRTITFEVGIQNAPLAVVIVLTLMPQHSESALIVATWGGWQILACLLLAMYWSRRV